MPAGSKVTAEEVARWRELRRRGWTYQRIAAGSGWTEAAVYMRLTGRERGLSYRTAPTLRPASTVTSESGPLRTSRPRGRIARLLSPVVLTVGVTVNDPAEVEAVGLSPCPVLIADNLSELNNNPYFRLHRLLSYAWYKSRVAAILPRTSRGYLYKIGSPWGPLGSLLLDESGLAPPVVPTHRRRVLRSPLGRRVSRSPAGSTSAVR